LCEAEVKSNLAFIKAQEEEIYFVKC